MESYIITKQIAALYCKNTRLFDSCPSIVDKFRVNFPNENFACKVHGHVHEISIYTCTLARAGLGAM